jgi:protein-L-isoaspartate O-methyltransferase
LKTFEDPKVYKIMQQVDRMDFVPEGKEEKAYINSTAEIGWNTTISTPKVHS